VAVGTGHQLDLLNKGVPFPFGAVKAGITGHRESQFWESSDCSEVDGRGVAGYDKKSRSGVWRRVRSTNWEVAVCRIVGVINIPRCDDNSATFAQKCDQSGGKDTQAARL
jgi:hypothetical protein